MIRLPKKDNPVALFSILIGLLLLHVLAVSPASEEKHLKYTPMHLVSQENPFHHPPAVAVDGEDRAHLLTYAGGGKMNYVVLTPAGERARSEEISLPAPGEVEYYAPVEGLSRVNGFIVVLREGENFRPYLLLKSRDVYNWLPAPFGVAMPKDVAAVRAEEDYYFAYVEKRDGSFTLLLQVFDGKGWGEPRPLAVSDRFLGLPRIAVDRSGDLHLTWKGSKGNLDAQCYRFLQMTPAGLRPGERQVLGEAASFFGETYAGTRTHYYEDIGARLCPSSHGGMYITWTYSYWEVVFGTLHSSFFLARISPEGRLEEVERFKGRQDFALFADVVVDKRGYPVIYYEDYHNRTFHLMEASYNTSKGEWDKQRITTSFGSHRLVSAEQNTKGDTVLLWKHMAGDSDEVYFRSTAQAAGPRWYDRWSMSFIRDGSLSSVQDGFFVVIYSLVAALVSVGSNALVIVGFGVLFYLLQSRGILGRYRFFLLMVIVSGVLTFCKLSGGPLYMTPVPESGFNLFAALLATATVCLLSIDYWKKDGDELLLLNHVLIWVFTDSLISFLYVAPSAFAP